MGQRRRNYSNAAYDKFTSSAQTIERRHGGSGHHNSKTAGGRNQGGDTEEFIYGNVVRKLEPQRRQQEVPARKPKQHNEVRKNRDKARHMSAGYVLFLAAALCAAAFILVNYIQLQSQLTNLTESVASRQSRLNYLRTSNNEEYNRIVNSVDLEEIKRIAMGELGMIYAQEGQIIEYEGNSKDYMRQATESNY